MGEWHDPETHLIPLILRAAAGETDHIRIFGSDYPTPDGTCVRDYVHVTDLARAHMLALDRLLSGAPSAVYNLGNSRGYSVREVIALAEEVTRRGIPAVEARRRAGDPAVLVAGSQRIKSELGWRPQYEDLKTIIQTAWQWQQKRGEPRG